MVDRINTDEAFVTLATNDSYAIGALVLGSSLKAVGTTRSLAVMITFDVSDDLREYLEQVFDIVTVVNVLDSQDAANLLLLTRPELGITFTKLHCWRLTQFNKCVFLDSDTLVLQNIDELFNYDELSAAPDIGWPDCFNSGVFVYHPSLETYSALLDYAVTKGSFDGGDQGLLNLFFNDWATKDIKNRLSFVYNVVSQEFYTYQPAFKQFGKNAKVAHFIGPSKPWHTNFNTSTRSVTAAGEHTHRAEFLQHWWKIFTENVQPHFKSSVGWCSEKFSTLSICTDQPAINENRQYDWERGQIDYLGTDSFNNILTQLNSKIATPNNDSLTPPNSKTATPDTDSLAQLERKKAASSTSTATASLDATASKP